MLDLNQIMFHYVENVILISPVATKLLNAPSGTITEQSGTPKLLQKRLEVYPDLNFELLDVMWGLSVVLLHQPRHKTGNLWKSTQQARSLKW